MFIFLLLLAGVGFFVAFNANALPVAVYDYVYQNFDIATTAQTPSLEKFEGHWEGTLVPAAAWSDVERCPTNNGAIHIHNGAVTGTLGGLNNYVTVKAQVDQFGNLIGTTVGGGQNMGTVTGVLLGTAGTGKWKDSLDCRGSVTFRKLDPVIDPIAGKILSFIDGVSLRRSGKSETPALNEGLYPGDVVDVPAGASVNLTIGTGFDAQPKTLTGPTTYTVTAPVQ